MSYYSDDGHPRARSRRSRPASPCMRTARRLFAEQGFDATSLQQIADAMGVQKANVYYYFKTKSAILEELIAVDGRTAARSDRQSSSREPDRGRRARMLARGYAAAVVHSYRTEGPAEPRRSDASARSGGDRRAGPTSRSRPFACSSVSMPTPDQRAGFWTDPRRRSGASQARRPRRRRRCRPRSSDCA